MKPQLTDVLQCLTHLLHFSSWHEVDGVPVPLVMNDAVVEVDGPVGGDKMIWEDALTSGRNVQLLGPLFKMHFGGRSVPTPDVDGGVTGQIGYEMSLAELVNSLLNRHDLKGAQGLGSVERLHVEQA
jgi:hypothetical protein